MWRWMIMVLLGAQVNAASANEYLAERGPVKVDFTASADVSEPTVSVSVQFIGDGSQPLRPDGSITVNGIPVPGKPITKQGMFGRFQIGYWYQTHIPKAERYELVFRRAADQPEVRYVVLPRKFQPRVPPVISRSAELRIPFDGPPLSNSEQPHAKVSAHPSVRPQDRWQVFLRPRAEGNQFVIVPTDSRQEVKLGLADLHIGVVSYQQSSGSRDEIAYAVSEHATVEITE